MACLLSHAKRAVFRGHGLEIVGTAGEQSTAPAAPTTPTAPAVPATPPVPAVPAVPVPATAAAPLSGLNASAVDRTAGRSAGLAMVRQKKGVILFTHIRRAGGTVLEDYVLKPFVKVSDAKATGSSHTHP